MVLSVHANRRCQQRAIPSESLRAALDWGDVFYVRERRMAFFLGRRATARAARRGICVEPYTNTLVIVGDDGTVITAIRTTRCNHLGKGRRR